MRPMSSRAAASRLASILARWRSAVAAHPYRSGLGLYLWALGVRLVYLVSFKDTMVARVPLMDEAFYHAEAWSLARGAPALSEAWFMTPLYPWFLSFVFRFVGDGTPAYAVQLALGALVAPLTFFVAKRVMHVLLAVATAAALACFAPLVFFEALYLVEGLVLLALLGATCAAVATPRRRNAWIAGVLLGVAVLGRGSNLVLAIPFAWWFARRPGPGRAWARAGAMIAGILLVLAPLLVHNTVRAHRPFMLTANAGFNLYIGNGPEATGIFVRLPALDLAQDPLTVRHVQRALGRAVTVTEASDYWMDRTRDWVRRHPAATAWLFTWKMILFWNRLSIPQVEGFASAAAGTALETFPFWRRFDFLPFALVGMVIAVIAALRGHRRPRDESIATGGLLAACAFVYSASIALFFVTDRYRVPALPWIANLGAMALQMLVTSVPRARRLRLLILLPAIAIGFMLTDPRALRVDRRLMERDLRVHTSLRYARAGEFDRAVQEYRAALALDPANASLRDGLARMLSRAGHDSLAIEEFRALVTQHPEDGTAWYNLGNAYKRAGRASEALAAYRRALDQPPEREAAWNNAGEIFRALGDTARAATAYRRALAIVPAYDRALNNLAALRGALGDGVEAEAGFRAALAANPRYLPALTNLAILLGDTGREVEARAVWWRLLTIAPEDERAMDALRRLGENPDSARRGRHQRRTLPSSSGDDDG
jgi:tetratricopeptide (TPR) repeat protein